MPLLHAIILGAIQGLTEFLPISSDGHLVVANLLLGVSLSGRDALGFDILLHGASLLAILLVERALWWKILSSPFRKDRESMKLFLLLAVSVIPAGIAGFLYEEVIAGELRSIVYAALGFIMTGFVLILGESIGRNGRRGMESITLGRTILIGCAQAVALLPGVSRSGCTMSMGRALGLTRETALRFSFLMVVPAIVGALAKTALDVADGSVVFPPLLSSLTGFVTAFIVSIFAMLLLRTFVARFSLAWFAWYLFPLAAYLLFEAWNIRELIDLPHVEEYVRRYGAIAVFLFSFMETVPPISVISPGVFALVIAGTLAADWSSGLLFWAAAVSAVTLGNVLLYVLGERYGRNIAHRLHLTEERLAKVDGLMRRFGRIAVIIGQFVGPARPVMAFVAGTLNMPRKKYYTSMIPAACAWAGYNMLLGYVAKSQLLLVLSVVGVTGYIVPAVAALFFGAERLHHRRTRKSSEEEMK